MFLAAFGDEGLIEREREAETGELGRWRKTEV